MKGGAERVLRVLAAMFPDAPIYTLLYDEKKLGNWFPKERMAQLPTTYRNNHHLHLSRFPTAVETWNFSEFDFVISSSSAFVHGIITNSQPKHLCYVHSPARYLWDRTHDILERSHTGLFGSLKHAYASRLFHRLRTWDSEVADRPDKLLAASKEVQKRIEKYWRRESSVVYPPIDDFWFNRPTTYLPTISSYFLIVSSLVPYKRIELAIEACNQLQFPLKIAGSGSHRTYLEKIAGQTVEFLGFQTDEKLRELYTHATATLFPGEEDFGLVPLESMACGTPVIAYKSGGALETIINGQTGIFFEEPTSESLAETLQTFTPLSFDPKTCCEQAEQFSRKRFEEKITQTIDAFFVTG